MRKFTKAVFSGVVALGLLAPVATTAFHSNQITVSAKRRYHYRRRFRRRVTRRRRSSALSYATAKRAVRKAYNGKDRYHDHFRLRNHTRRGRYTSVKAAFGAHATIYFNVRRVGRNARVHATIRTNTGAASRKYYRFYKINRTQTVRL